METAVKMIRMTVVAPPPWWQECLRLAPDNSAPRHHPCPLGRKCSPGSNGPAHCGQEPQSASAAGPFESISGTASLGLAVPAFFDFTNKPIQLQPDSRGGVLHSLCVFQHAEALVGILHGRCPFGIRMGWQGKDCGRVDGVTSESLLPRWNTRGSARWRIVPSL